MSEETLEERDPHHGLRAVLVLEHGESVYERYIESDAEDYWDIRSGDRRHRRHTRRHRDRPRSDSGRERNPRRAASSLGRVPDTRNERDPPVGCAHAHGEFRRRPHEANAAGVWSSPDPIGAILIDRARRGAGDGAFRYSDAGSHILSAVVAEASGMPVLEFARRECVRSPRHRQPACVRADRPWRSPRMNRKRWCARTTTPTSHGPRTTRASTTATQAYDCGHPIWRELGQLYLDRGRWDDEQLVSERLDRAGDGTTCRDRTGG